MSDQREMPKYRSHKVVQAVKIAEVMCDTDRAHGAIIPEDLSLTPIAVTGEYLKKHNPEPGGYFVVYPDGYRSFSPAEAFESGYSRI